MNRGFDDIPTLRVLHSGRIPGAHLEGRTVGADRGHAAGSGYLMTAPVTFSATRIAGIVLTASALIAVGEIDTIAVGQPAGGCRASEWDFDSG